MNIDNGVETLTNSDKDKANTLTDFFSSVFTTETKDKNPSLEGINISYNMGTLVIDEEKVKKRLHELNISKSPGPDGLHPRIILDLYEELGKPIAIIFKNSIENKNIPNEWREGCIAALFKTGSRKMASYYRPVNLTCILCKVLEKFIRDHILNHMKRNTLFSPKQFGFISGRSTSLQLLYVLERWTNIQDEGGSLD